MGADKLDVVESGVLTASPQRWEQAESRFAVLAPLLEMHPVGLSVVDDAAEGLGLSSRQGVRPGHDLSVTVRSRR